MIELLSPAGDFDCLKAAIQNGADAIYFGASSFSARAFASNFDDESLEKAITYAKLRGVKTNLALNTLIKNDELSKAIELAQKAYSFGIDAIIVQDLGLARYLIKNFPDLAIHASTQLSVHNLEGVLKLQEMGFSRVVLSRELSLQEIKHICKNSNIEIEVFVHGALCISYSGQCLFSSMVGGRSGNRGKCAQPCRLPYELISAESCPPSSKFKDLQANSFHSIDKGYLLSPSDLCGLDYLPELIKAGVTCLKIEGRMKTPEYVATVTRIYRKYLDIALNTSKPLDKKILSQNLQNEKHSDRQDLLQVFNRGGFTDGHLSSKPNTNLVYKYKSNNMGIFLGKISNFNSSKGHITFTTESTLSIGDKIGIENKKNETSLYTVSELMINKKNVATAFSGDTVKIGRMKGDISIGNKLYKMSDKQLSTAALETINKENRKIFLNCKLIVKKDLPISLTIYGETGVTVKTTSSVIPVPANNSPITADRLIAQISKTNNTPFQFKNIEIDLDDGLFIQGISCINELRKTALFQYEEKLINSFKRVIYNKKQSSNASNINTNSIVNTLSTKEVSVLLNILHTDFNYANLKGVTNVYIPLKYFVLKKFDSVLKQISKNFNMYIYMPTIIKNNYNTLIKNNLPNILYTYNIKGFVLSNIGNYELLKKYQFKYEFVCNYTFNVFNSLSLNELCCDTATLSPELSLGDLQNILSHNNCSKKTELIVHSRIPLMNLNYCLLGKANKCHTACSQLCNSTVKFYLKDRFGFLFRVIPDNIDTTTTIYNSRISSIDYKKIDVNSIRIDVLDETIEEINSII